MSWLRGKPKLAPGSDRSSKSEILACFEEQKDVLSRLGWLIVGDEAKGEAAVLSACEIAARGTAPLKWRLREWTEWVTVKAAISESRDAICACELSYHGVRCTHSQHLQQECSAEVLRDRNFLLRIDPCIMLAELDPLARSVLILRTMLRASFFDCTLRLNMSSEVVVAANCQATAWLRVKQNYLAKSTEHCP